MAVSMKVAIRRFARGIFFFFFAIGDTVNGLP